jgi:hypothetical protein
MDQVGEKFPSFEDTRSEEKSHRVTSPQAYSQSANPLSVNNWPVRKSGQTGWENRNGGGVLHKHRPRRSVSEAFDNFRQRRGSISANTHELAEALKAPISYKLIVSASRLIGWQTSNIAVGALYFLVHDIRAHQYVLEIYPERVSETRDIDNCSVRLCLTMVSRLCLLGFRLPEPENSYSSTEERH